jgi:hypothetical protein
MQPSLQEYEADINTQLIDFRIHDALKDLSK